MVITRFLLTLHAFSTSPIRQEGFIKYTLFSKNFYNSRLRIKRPSIFQQPFFKQSHRLLLHRIG